jgi:hypothetical protein
MYLFHNSAYSSSNPISSQDNCHDHNVYSFVIYCHIVNGMILLFNCLLIDNYLIGIHCNAE